MDPSRVGWAFPTWRGVINAAACMTKTYTPLVDAAGLGLDSGQRLIQPAR